MPTRTFTPGSSPSGTLFDWPTKLKRKAELDEKMGGMGFWDDQESAKAVVAEAKVLKTIIEPVDAVMNGLADAKAMYDLGAEALDQESLIAADQMLHQIQQKAEKVELQALLDGKNDHRNCFFQIHAGAGGTEAQDWAEMLCRMYIYWFEKRGWDVSEVDRTEGEQAGIKNVVLLVKGPYAYGYCRAEVGVHRLVRPSPFNAQGKRQTSFSSVDVVPEFDDDQDVEIPAGDLEITPFVRSSGPGGQNVNKVASAVRIVHLPTGIQVTCSVERSQQQNRRMAMAMLKGKLEQMEAIKRDDELKRLYGEKGAIAWGSQIRSYVLDDRRVKDHRTNVETSQVEAVLDRGELDEYVDAELRRRKKMAKPANA